MILIDAILIGIYATALWYACWLLINGAYIAGVASGHFYRKAKRSLAEYKLSRAEGVVDTSSAWFKAERLFNTCTRGRFAS